MANTTDQQPIADSASEQQSRRLERETCSRCGGSGHYSSCERWGTTCFKCKGQKVVLTKRGAEAARYLKALRSRATRDLKPGDRIRVGQITVGGDPYSAWATVVSIEGYVNTVEHRINGVLQPQRQDLLILTTDKVVTQGVAPEAMHEMSLSPEERARTLKEALDYQDTLTKQGTPRKR